jgi:hypothetical protein
VDDATVNVALVLLNVTEVAPVKFVPLIVTVLPAVPLAGLKPVIVGGLSTVNAGLLAAVPAGVLTLKIPLVAPAGTVA